MLSNLGRALLVLSTFTVRLAHTQSVSSLPQCIQNCIDQSQDDNCSVTDVKCLCKASAGNFLPDLITCMHSECDNTLDNDLLLTPLQLICELAGAPIPGSAISSAQNQASSLAATTVTVGGASEITGYETTTTVTETKSGSTIYIVYPITIGSTTTVSGQPSTVTLVSTELSISTYTTTNSRGKTVTTTSTFTEIDGPSASEATSSSVSSTTTFTTSIQAKQTSSSVSSASKTSVTKPETTNSSPFTTTNGNAGYRERLGVGFLIGGIIFAVLIHW